MLLFIMAAMLMRSAMAPLAIGGSIAALQAFLWVFSPWAAHLYADSVGLPIRDAVQNDAPSFPVRLPS